MNNPTCKERERVTLRKVTKKESNIIRNIKAVMNIFTVKVVTGMFIKLFISIGIAILPMIPYFIGMAITFRLMIYFLSSSK